MTDDDFGRFKAMHAGIMRLMLAGGLREEAERERVWRYQNDATYHAKVYSFSRSLADALLTATKAIDESEEAFLTATSSR